MPIPQLTSSGRDIPAAKPTLSYPSRKPQQNHGGLPHPGPLGLIFLRFNWAVERLSGLNPEAAAPMQAKPWNFSLNQAEQMLRDNR